MELILHDVICSLSSSLDLVGISEVHHGARVAFMAATVAQALGFDKETELDLLYAGMLHDCGLSTSEERTHFASEIKCDDFYVHCVRGHDYLRDCAVFEKYASWVLHHHTHWQKLKNYPLSTEDKLAANLIFLADRVDFLRTEYLKENDDADILLGKVSIVEQIICLRDSYFSPQLVDSFVEVSKREAFWLAMSPSYIHASIDVYASFSKPKQVNFETLKSIATLFSKVIDEKSHFTKEHSKHVAMLSSFLAEKMGFDTQAQQHIELAGMLHDLGKLRVPNHILDKNDKLNQSEYACILHHSFDTKRILQKVFPNTKIAEWAGNHHENLLGNGYPFRLKGSELDLGSRIVTVADIFQALVQNRPYRDSLSLQEIKDIMDDMVLEGKLDKHVISVLEHHYKDCYHLAQPSCQM